MKNISFIKNVHIFPNFICAYQKKAVFSTNYPFTGDHRIFHAWMSDDIREYGLRANLPFGTGQAGCPLIIKAPQMVSQRTVKQARQIDIYPTILYYIGQEDYFWKGMGCSLKEGETPSNENDDLRRQLSDKLIRMNYFAD